MSTLQAPRHITLSTEAQATQLALTTLHTVTACALLDHCPQVYCELHLRKERMSKEKEKKEEDEHLHIGQLVGFSSQDTISASILFISASTCNEHGCHEMVILWVSTISYGVVLLQAETYRAMCITILRMLH